MTESEALSYNRGYDLATSRAASRQALGLPIEQKRDLPSVAIDQREAGDD